MNYHNIRAQLRSIEGTKLTLVDETNIDELGVPVEYIKFLSEVGCGTIGRAQFQFYDGIVFFDEIFGYDSEETREILIFGDDFQGACTGFIKDGCVVRVLPDLTVVQVANSFEEFISREFCNFK